MFEKIPCVDSCRYKGIKVVKRRISCFLGGFSVCEVSSYHVSSSGGQACSLSTYYACQLLVLLGGIFFLSPFQTVLRDLTVAVFVQTT